MTARNFPKCLAHTLRHEGGYVDHPKDPGGATNRGITIGTLSAYLGRPATKQEVRALDVVTAGHIYRQRYWYPVRGDDLPDGMDLVAFDGGVNSGPRRGAKWLQKGLRVTADGRIGPQSLGAAERTEDGVAVIQRACAARLGFLRGLRTWGTFGRGWGRRVAGVEAEAVAMYSRDVARVEAEAVRAEVSAKARRAQAGGAGAGGAGVSLTNMPDLVFYGALGLVAVIAVLLIARAANHKDRAAAYKGKLKEMGDG